MVTSHARLQSTSPSCTRDAAAFAAALRRRPGVGDLRARRAALAAAAGAVDTAAARLVARAADVGAAADIGKLEAGDDGVDPFALAAEIAERRFAHAADEIAKIVAARDWRRICVAGPSWVVEQAVAARGAAVDVQNGKGVHRGRDGIVAVVVGDPDAALRLAAEPGIVVEYSPLAAAGSVMASCDVVLLGAEAVHQDGRLVVADGSGVLAMLASELRVATHALVQTIKFERDVLLAELGKPRVELLDGQYVSNIITEIGNVAPRDVPKVAAAHGVS